MKSTGEVFRETMARFEKAFTVGLIATVNPVGCGPTDLASDVLEQYPDFDQFPVFDGPEVLGVLDRKTADPNKPVSEQRENTALRGSILISDDEPLERLIPVFMERPYFLVVRGQKIDALVTRSDLVKLPVQLLALTLVTHLEQVMAQTIRTEFGKSDGWTHHLSESSKSRLTKSQKELQRERANPDLLDLTYFADKAAVVGAHLALGEQFAIAMKALHKLRNDVSHPKDFVGDDKTGLPAFVKRLSDARHWIEQLSQRLTILPDSLARARTSGNESTQGGERGDEKLV